MTSQPAKSTALMQLLQVRSGLIVHQALHAAAKLGVADLLERGVDTSAKLASALKVNERRALPLAACTCQSGNL
jgi:hypothetical protein